MIIINCTTEEYRGLMNTFENSAYCPFQENPKIKCTLDYNEYKEGEEELTCIPCLKKYIVWVIED